MIKRKQAQIYRPGFIVFVSGWVATHVVAMCCMMVFSVLSGALGLFSDLWSLIFIGILATLQFFWLRRSWRISLHSWLPLAVIGLIVGEVAFQIFDANVVYPFPPKLYSGSSMRMPEPEHIMQLKYAIYQTVRSFLHWSTPLLFQWLTLRKRFRGDGLWLVAALVHAPLTYSITEYGGILSRALKLLDNFTEISLTRDLQSLGSIAYLIDWATPTLIMGIALYWLMTQPIFRIKLTSARLWRCRL